MNYIEQVRQLKPKYRGDYVEGVSTSTAEFLCSAFRGCPRGEENLLIGCDACILSRKFPEDLLREEADIFSFLNRIIVLGE